MPNAEIPWDRKAVEKAYIEPPKSWTRQQLEDTIYRRVEPDYFHVPKAFDPASIMIFPIPKTLTVGGFEIGVNWRLSAIDKEFIAKLYPAP